MGVFRTLLAMLDTSQKILIVLKELHMDFTELNAAMAKLANDVSDEIAAALAAVEAAKAGDQSKLDQVVASLKAVDGKVTAAKEAFAPPAPAPVA